MPIREAMKMAEPGRFTLAPPYACCLPCVPLCQLPPLAAIPVAVPGIDDRANRIIRIIFRCRISSRMFIIAVCRRFVFGPFVPEFQIVVCHASHLPVGLISRV